MYLRSQVQYTSVSHRKPLSSTPKTLQFNTKTSSVPHTPQFHTEHPSVPHRLYRAIFCLRGVLNLAEKDWPFCVKLTCGTEGDPNKYGTRTLSCDLKLLKGDSQFLCKKEKPLVSFSIFDPGNIGILPNELFDEPNGKVGNVRKVSQMGQKCPKRSRNMVIECNL